MSIQNAVEARETGGAPAGVSLEAVVKDTLERQERAFHTVLPGEADPKRFTRLVISAVKQTPGLIQCFATNQGQTSLLICAMQAASVGLEPNTPNQEAWLLPFKNGQVTEAQLILGYRGLLKLLRRSGNIRDIQAFDVRQGDEFDWRYGLTEDYLHYKQGPSGQRGELVYAYANARLMTGGSTFVVLNEEDIHKRRAMSPSWKSVNKRQYSPWSTWTEAMWRKSALKAVVPYLELSSAASRVIAQDEQPLRFDANLGEIVGSEDTWSVPELGGDTDDDPGHTEETAPSTEDAAPAPSTMVHAATVKDLIALATSRGVVRSPDEREQRQELTYWVNAQYETHYQHPGQFIAHKDRVADAEARLQAMPEVGESA